LKCKVGILQRVSSCRRRENKMKSRVGKIFVIDSEIRFSFSSSILEFTSLSIYTFLFSFARVACVYCLCIPQASSSADGNGHSEDLLSQTQPSNL
jgi:hypothetical protein